MCCEPWSFGRHFQGRPGPSLCWVRATKYTSICKLITGGLINDEMEGRLRYYTKARQPVA